MTKDEKRNEKALKLMAQLDCSYEEAYQVVLDDEAVDRGEALPWDLTPEQMKASKKARQADHAKPKEKVKRERKKNDVKETLISDLANFLEEQEKYSSVEITNSERQIAFTLGDLKFELTLVQKREKKQ